MPFIANNLTEEQKKKQLEQQSGGFDVSGQSTTFNQSQNNQPSSPKPQTRSGSWTNLQSYLDANQQQAADMGNTIADKVESQATKGIDSINQFKASAPGVVSDFNANDWFTNPDANKKTEYASLKSTGGYSGPDSVDKIQDYQKYYDEANKASQMVDNTATETGRFNLLQDTFSRPTYTQGQKKLDNVLLQKNDASKQRFEQLGTQYKGILDLFNSEADKAGQQINSNILKSSDNKNAIVQAEAKAKTDLLNSIQANTDSITNSNNKYLTAYNDIADDSLDAATLELLGLNSGSNLYDLNLQNYIAGDMSAANLDKGASAEQRAQYNALASMIDDPSMNIINPNGQTMDAARFDRAKYDSDFKAKDDAYRAAYASEPTNWNGVSAKQLEEYWLPMFTKNEWQMGIDQVNAALNEFKNKYSANRRIK